MNKVLLMMAILLLALMPVVATAGPPETVVCGQSVISSIKLANDLNCDTTPGLIVGAEDITINLNGHTIQGVACAFCHGIRNGDSDADPPTPGYSGVTIKNGTVKGFEQGIRGWQVEGFTIRNVTVRDQTTSNAIDIIESKNVTVQNVSVVLSGPGAPEAIRLEDVEGARVMDVDVDGGGVGVNFGCAPCNAGEETTGTIAHSTFTNNGNAILIAASSDARVTDNTVTDSSGASVLVGLNFLETFLPLLFPPGTFPTVTGVHLSNNTITGSGGNGIWFSDADASVLSGNTVQDSAGDGITLTDGSTGNRITENTATGSTGVDMRHGGGSTPNFWDTNTCDTSAGADIDCP